MYGSLISLIQDEKIQLENKRVMMFSYGSGAASTMFFLKIKKNVNFMRALMNIKENMQRRIKISPSEYTEILAKKEALFGKPNIQTQVKN